jgi:outer membrane murein-binding lipoprotein Lpp
MDSPQTAPSLALAAFSEDLITGRRVVVFGNALSGLAETLVERGARLIHVYDEDQARVAEAAARSTSSAVSFAPLAPGGIAARDGAFDVGFVEEVAAFADAAQLVTRLRRALSARGVGFVCTANPDVAPLWATTPASRSKGPFSYYELYDLVSTQFDEVRMVGQTPFAGYALADFSPDTESEFSIDTGFVPGGAEEPERYVAVCSHFPVAIEPFCVVQMEAAALVGRDALVERAPAAGTPAAATKPTPAKPVDAVSHAQLAELRQELTSERSAKTKLEQLLRDVNDELKRRDEWVTELESRATTADERADAAEAALERFNAQQIAAKQQRARAEEQQRTRTEEQRVRAEEQRRNDERRAGRESDQSQELRERERKLEEVSRELADARQQLATGAEQLATNTQQLAARAQQVTQLEHQVADLQRELSLAELEKAKAEHAKSRAETTRDEALGKLEALEGSAASYALAEQQLAELQANVTELRGQVASLRSDLQLAGEEIARAEQQLVEQGGTVRQLRADLVDTERFAALLLAQYSDPVVVESVATVAAPFEPDIASEVTVPSVAPTLVLDTESIDDIPSLASTSLSERATAETAPTSTPGDETRALADARAREAELQAALQATRWTVEELESRLSQKSNEQELIERLYRAEHQLQRQATLIAQYERGLRAAPPTSD